MRKNGFILLIVALASGLAAAGFTLGLASARGHEAPPTIHCVNASGSGCAPGLSGGCYKSLQEAVDAAQSGDIIRVAGGVYTAPNGRLVALHGKGLSIEGGYDLACGTQDADLYPTILDGEGKGNVISVTQTGGDVFLRWLTITNGNGDGNCSSGGYGYGCGGGVYVSNSDLRLGHSRLIHNSGAASSPGRGGGIYILNSLSDGHFVHIFDTEIISNTCSISDTAYFQSGAGVEVWGSEVRLNDDRVVDNYCPGTSDGGGAYLDEISNATLHNNLFERNHSGRTSAGVHISGPPVNVEITQNRFQANAGSLGGAGSGIWLINAVGQVDGNRFEGNTGGDVVRIRNSPYLTLTNNLLAENDGGIVVVGVSQPSQVNLTNNTLVGNGGSGLYAGYSVTATLVNNIIAEHDVSFWTDEVLTGTITLDHNLLWNQYESFTSTNNTLADPLLLENYYPSSKSPAIDAGLTIPWLDHDIDGNPRPIGKGYDIGAFEYSPRPIYLPLVEKLPLLARRESPNR